MATKLRRDRRVLLEWSRFVRAQSHRLRDRPGEIHQLAAHEPDGGVLSEAARAHSSSRTWLRWINKGSAARRELLTLVVESPGFEGDAIFSPDGRRVVAGSGSGVSIFDAETGEPTIRCATGASPLSSLAVAAAGDRIATETSDALLLWDAATGALVAELAVGRTRSLMRGRCEFSRDGSRLLALAPGYALAIWDAADGRPVARLEGHTGPVVAAAWSPDGHRIVTASRDGSLRMWDSFGDGSITFARFPEGWAYDCSWSRDGSLVASAGAGKVVGLWDGMSGESRGELAGPGAPVRCCEFSPDGRRLVSSGEEGELWVFDVETGRALARLARDPNFIVGRCGYIAGGKWIFWSLGMGEVFDATSLVRVTTGLQGRFCDYSEITQTLLTGGQGSPLRLWPVSAIAAVESAESFLDCVFAPRARSLAARPSADLSDPEAGTVVSVFDGATGRPAARLHGHEGHVRDFAFDPTGDGLLSCSDDGTLRTWTVAPGRQRRVLRGHSSRVVACALAPDGSFASSGSNDGTVRVWNPARGTETACLIRARAKTDLVRISPDGRRIVALVGDSAIRLWSMPEMTEVAALPEHEDIVRDLRFSPDAALLASVAGSAASLWDARTGVHQRTLAGHEVAIDCCRFSPDGERLATAASDGVSVWSVLRGERHFFLPSPGRVCLDLGWSPDGEVLAAGWTNGLVVWWDAASGGEIVQLAGDDFGGLDWSPGGESIAIAGGRGGVRLFAMENRAPGPAVVVPWREEGGPPAFACPCCGEWSVLGSQRAVGVVACPTCQRRVRLAGREVRSDWRALARASRASPPDGRRSLLDLFRGLGRRGAAAVSGRAGSEGKEEQG